MFSMPYLFRNDCLIISVLQKPEVLSGLSLKQWDLLLRQARRANLLGKLNSLAENQGLITSLPDSVRNTLLAAKTISEKHKQTIDWEIFCINEALSDFPGPVIYLKGTAYILLGLPIANGRLFSDVDIMVPNELITKAEHKLIIKGWATIKQSRYDQMYYRKWMHEIPPLRHRRRQMVIDVHHHILPRTARYQPDINKLLNDSVQVGNNSNIRVLSPCDMILHSMTHLFCEGEFSHGLRDLVDMDGLIRYYSGQERFWGDLIKRADELQLRVPLFYGLRYTNNFLLTPIPDTIWKKALIWKPGRFRLFFMDELFKRSLLPEHDSCNTYFTSLARFILYIRGHYLRMPFHLLIPHLIVKLLMGWKENKAQ